MFSCRVHACPKLLTKMDKMENSIFIRSHKMKQTQAYERKERNLIMASQTRLKETVKSAVIGWKYSLLNLS